MPVSTSSNNRFHILLLLGGLAVTVAPRGSYAQVPAAPTDARTVIRGEDSVDLTWVDNSDNEVAFDVFRSDGGGELRLLGAVDADLTLFQDRASGLVPNVEYCYELEARNSFGSSEPSNLSCITIPPRPVSPSGLISSRSNDNAAIILTWIDNATNEDGFLVYRDTRGTGFILEDTVAASISRYEDKEVRTEGQYCYFVSAFNVSGESAGTNTSCIDITVGDPTLPTSFETEPLSSSDIKITWEFDLVTHSELTLERSIGGLDPWTEVLRTPALVTEHFDSNLDSFTEYCYRILVQSVSGARATTDLECSQTEFTVPPIPHNVSADGLEGRSIFLSWSLDPSPQVRFRIERRDGLGPYQLLADSVDAFQYTDAQLLDDEIYCYRVKSFNPEFESDFSSIACAIVAPSTVANLQVTAGPTHPTREITASWQQGEGTPATSFEVSHRVTGIGEFSPPTVTDGLSLLIEGLDDAVEYEVQVVAFRTLDSLSENSGPEFATGSTFLAGPVPPSGLISSRPDNNAAITLTWIDNSTDEDGFLVYRDTSGTEFILEDTVAASISRYEDTEVRTEGRYCYRVNAFNGLGETEGSNISCIDITVGDPTLPTSFETESLSGSDIKITWEFDLVTHSELTLERSVGGLDPWIELLRTTELVTGHLDSNLDSFTEYCYRLIVQSVSGARSMTDIECSETEFTVPPVPDDVSADGLEGRSIFLSWSLDPSPQVLFWIERRDGLGQYQLLADSVDAFQYTDVKLLDDEIYCYRVKSVNPDNPEFESDFSSGACAIVAPSPVSNLRVTAGPGHPAREITASWQQGAGTPATSFEVSHRQTGTGDFTPPAVTNGLSFLIEGLDDAVEYEVQVVAYRTRDSLSENSGPEFAAGSTFLAVWPGDMDNDGSVTANDAVVLTSPVCFGMTTNLSTDGLDVSWSERGVDPSGMDETVIRCDADQNGAVDIFDFLAIAANFEKETGKAKSRPVASTLIRSEAHRQRLQQIYKSFVPAAGDVGQERLKKDLGEILRKAGTEIIPDELGLGFSYPNPVRDRALIPVDLPSEAVVQVSVFDAVGRRVMVLVSERYHAGSHEIRLEASALPPGVYLIVMETDGAVLSRPMIVVR